MFPNDTNNSNNDRSSCNIQSLLGQETTRLYFREAIRKEINRCRTKNGREAEETKECGSSIDGLKGRDFFYKTLKLTSLVMQTPNKMSGKLKDDWCLYLGDG